MATHRYWRIYINDTAGGLHSDIAEITLCESSAFTDVTGSGTALASSNFGAGWEESRAYDNNNTTRWASLSVAAPHWIGYDFGAGNDKDITHFSLRCASGAQSRMPTDFDLEYSDDGSSWTGVLNFISPDWASAEVRQFSSVPAPARVTKVGLRVLTAAAPAARVTKVGFRVLTVGEAGGGNNADKFFLVF